MVFFNPDRPAWWRHGFLAATVAAALVAWWFNLSVFAVGFATGIGVGIGDDLAWLAWGKKLQCSPETRINNE